MNIKYFGLLLVSSFFMSSISFAKSSIDKRRVNFRCDRLDRNDEPYRRVKAINGKVYFSTTSGGYQPYVIDRAYSLADNGYEIYFSDEKIVYKKHGAKFRATWCIVEKGVCSRYDEETYPSCK